ACLVIVLRLLSMVLNGEDPGKRNGLPHQKLYLHGVVVLVGQAVSPAHVPMRLSHSSYALSYTVGAAIANPCFSSRVKDSSWMSSEAFVALRSIRWTNALPTTTASTSRPNSA